MGVILTVLGIIKIIFIILLCIFAALLLLALYLFIAPFYYKVSVSHRLETNYSFKVASLLRTVVLTGDSVENQMILTILWFYRKKLSMDGGGDSEDLPRESGKIFNTLLETRDNLWKSIYRTDKKSKATSEVKDAAKEAKAAADQTKETKNASEETKDATKENGKKLSRSEKYAAKRERRWERREKRWEKREMKRERRRKMRRIWKTIRRIKNFPHKREVFKATIKLFKELINAIKPKDLKVQCLFGLSDPYETGIALAAISAVKPFVRVGGIVVEADFENEIFEIDISAKGWFNLISAFIPLFRYVKTKPVWKIIKAVIAEVKNQEG